MQSALYVPHKENKIADLVASFCAKLNQWCNIENEVMLPGPAVDTEGFALALKVANIIWRHSCITQDQRNLCEEALWRASACCTDDRDQEKLQEIANTFCLPFTNHKLRTMDSETMVSSPR